MAGEPKNIDYMQTLDFIESIDARLVPFYKELSAKGWRFYIIDQRRGYCHYQWKTITIPAWVLSKDVGKQTWYLAHEMAHAYAPVNEMHGPGFMRELIRICPAEYIHHELGYKPRNARAAGIGEDKFQLLDL